MCRTTAIGGLALGLWVAPAAAEPSARFEDAAPPATEPAATTTASREPSPAGASSPIGFSRRLAQAHYERARDLERRGDVAEALSEYTRSLAIDSTLGEAYLNLAGLRERMGDVREAELVYSEAIQLGDTRARALRKRSHLYRAAGQNQRALRDLEASVVLDANVDALQELARDYVEAHAFGAALFAYRRVLRRARETDDRAALEAARLEVRALRVLAAETDPTTEPAAKHDWVARSLVHIGNRS